MFFIFTEDLDIITSFLHTPENLIKEHLDELLINSVAEVLINLLPHARIHKHVHMLFWVNLGENGITEKEK